MIVECWNERGELRGVELDPQNRAYGWVYYKHPDGQWVTLRKATPDEIYEAECRLERCSNMAHKRYNLLGCTECFPVPLAPSGHRGDCYRDATDGVGYCTCDYAERFPSQEVSK